MRRRFFPLQPKNSIGYPSTDLSHESPNNSAYAIPINSKPLPNSCRSNMQSSIKALSSSPPKRSFHIKDPESIDPKTTLANSIPIQSPASVLPAGSFQVKQQLRHQMNFHFNDKTKITSSKNIDSNDGFEQNDSLLNDRQSSSKEPQYLSTTNKTKKVITFPIRDISPRLRFMQIPLDKINEQKPQGTQLPVSQKNQNKLINFESKQQQHDSKNQQQQQKQPQLKLVSVIQNPYASKQTKKLISSGGQRVRKIELDRNSNNNNNNSIIQCSQTSGNNQCERDLLLFSQSQEQQQFKGAEELQNKLKEICAFQRKCPSLKEKSKIGSRECSIVSKDDNESKQQTHKGQIPQSKEDFLLNPKSQCLNEQQKSTKLILHPRKSQSTMRQQSILRERERENKEKKIISDFSIYRVNSPQSSQNRFQTPQARLVINVDITTQPIVPVQIETFSRQESSREEHEQTINLTKNNNCFRGDNNQVIIPTSNTSNARKYLPQLIFRRQSKGDISSNFTKQEQTTSKIQSPQHKQENQNKHEEENKVAKEKRFLQVNHPKPVAQRFPPPPILISDLVDDFPSANSPIQGQRTPSQEKRILRKKEMNNQQTIKGMTPQAQGQFKQLFRRFNTLKQNSKEKNRISNNVKCPISEISTNTELSVNNNQIQLHNQELMFIPERSLTPDNNNMIQSLQEEESQEKRLNSQVSEEQQFEFLQLSFLNSFAWPQENSAIFEIKKDKWNQQEKNLDENARNNVLRAGLDRWESPKRQKKQEIFGDQISRLCDRREDIVENDKESGIMHKDDGANRSNIAINFSIDQSSISSSKSAERINNFQEKPSSRLENLVEEPSSPDLRNKNCLQMIVRQCKN